MEALVSQLESLPQTVSSLFAYYPDLAGIDISQGKQAIDTIATTLHKPAVTQTKPPTTANPTMPPRTKSYAVAAATTAKRLEQKPTKPGGAWLSQPFRPVESKRLIADFHRSPLKRQPPALAIRDRVNDLFDEWVNPFKVYAMKYTKSMNIVLSISPPSAVHLQTTPPSAPPLVELLRNIFDTPDDALILVYPDDMWHKVVINKITLTKCPSKSDKDVIKEILSEWKEYNSLALGLPRAAAPRIWFLIPSDATQDLIKTVSICVAIPDAKQARQLLREGTYFFGGHCRTSVYIPRCC